MRRSPLLLNLFCCLILLAGFNVASHFIFQTKRSAFIKRWEKVASSLPLNEPMDILFLGDSMTMESYVEPDFRARWEELSGKPVHTANAGIGASSILEHCLTLRKALAVNPDIKCVVYGVFGFRLTDPSAGRQLGNPAGEYVKYFVEDQEMSKQENGWNFQPQRILRWFPMFTEPSSYWIKVEVIRQKLIQQGMPGPTAGHRMARAAEIGFPKELEFIHHAKQFTSGKIGLIQPVEDIVQVCRKKGVPLVVVFMPTPKARRERFMERPEWTGYYGRIQAEFSAHNVTLIDASAWLDAPDEKVFRDPLHVNELGAHNYSVRIAEELYALPSFRSKIADGPGPAEKHP